MKRFNIIMLVDAAGENVLMCKRLRNPYIGLYNFVGGKAEPSEDGLHAAYRELREETGVTAADVTLRHLATFSYPGGGAGLPPYELEAYVGRLRHPVQVTGDENPLEWQPMDQNFFDLNRFAGEGSVGHIVETVRRYRPAWMKAEPISISLAPLTEAELRLTAYYQCTGAQQVIKADGCTVGAVTAERLVIFSPFCGCGIEEKALTLLAQDK